MTVETHGPAPHQGTPVWPWYAGVPAAAVVWWLVYGQLIPFSEWVTALFPVARDSHTGEAIAFFVYDVPKVLFLLTGIVFVTGVLRSWFSPEKTRATLAGKRANWGYPLAAALGTTLAFMMSAIALSLPEMIIRKQVLTYRLIAIFIAVVAAGILATGILFNAIL